VTVVSCPLGALLSGLADPFIRVVLGDKWVPMVGVLAVHGVWSAIRPFQNTASWLLNSSGGQGTLARINAYLLVPLVPALVIAAKQSGIVAVAWVIVAFTVLTLVAFVFAARRLLDLRPLQQFRAAAPALVACVPAWGASYGVAHALSSVPLAGLLLGAIAGLAAYAAALAAIDVDILRQSHAQIRRTLGR
jgi:O-antigen/teichoic acid export membrane protein